jgi:anaerobic nitric oxide reductase transcription regulator
VVPAGWASSPAIWARPRRPWEPRRRPCRPVRRCQPGQSLREATEAFQRQWLQALLARHGGVAAAAAREAGVDRSNFHRLLRRLGLAPA